MSKGIIHKIGKVAEFGTPTWRRIQNVSDELPTVADLVLPGTGRSFSDEFACLLTVLCQERESG